MLGEIKPRCRSRLKEGYLSSGVWVGVPDTSAECARRNQKSRTGEDLRHKAQMENQLNNVNGLGTETVGLFLIHSFIHSFESMN